MDRITAIGRIRIELGYTEADAAAEVKTTFGEGGNPQLDSPNPTPEEYLGFVNTPMTSAGYIRCSVKQAFGVALDYIKSIGGATTIELIEVEHDGQKMYQVGTIPASSGSIEHPAVYDEDDVLIEAAWTETWDYPEQPEWLGMINGCAVYHEPIIEEELI